MKTAIVVLSDPSGGEEALGRVFNALAAAYDFRQRGHAVEVLFQGTGTRWVSALQKADHPAHGLYVAVEDCITGASAACSAVFGATEDVKASDVAFVTGNQVPGTPGLPSLARVVAEGGTVLTF